MSPCIPWSPKPPGSQQSVMLGKGMIRWSWYKSWTVHNTRQNLLFILLSMLDGRVRPKWGRLGREAREKRTLTKLESEKKARMKGILMSLWVYFR